MTLTDFLLARIAEDEEVARAATPGPWQWWNLEGVDQGWSGQGPDLETVERGPVYSDGSQGAAETVLSAWGHDAWGINVERPDAEHIARHNPARVLAECEAKRRIIEASRFDPYSDNGGAEVMSYAVLSALALPYADHPDYCEGW